MAGRRNAFWFSGAVSLFVVVLLFGAYVFWPAFQQTVEGGWQVLRSGETESMRRWFDQFGAWGPLVIILAMVAQMFLIVLPSWGLMIVAVLASGPWWGFLLAVVAVLTASGVGYALGRGLGAQKLRDVVGEDQAGTLAGWVRAYGYCGIVLFRVSPWLSSDAISLTAGLLEMNFWRFFWATLTGIVPLAALIAYFGERSGTLKTGLYVVGGVGLVLYGLLVYLDRLRKRKA